MSLTLFEKIINREIPADIIYEDELSIVIKGFSLFINSASKS